MPADATGCSMPTVSVKRVSIHRLYAVHGPL